jgi:hypothetical protein
MLFSKGLLFGATIVEQVQGFLGQYVQMALNFIEAQSFWIQVGILAGLALFAIIGLFVFIKKFIKVFIVLAILGGIGYFVWTNTTIIQDLLAGITGGAIVNFFSAM